VQVGACDGVNRSERVPARAQERLAARRESLRPRSVGEEHHHEAGRAGEERDRRLGRQARVDQHPRGRPEPRAVPVQVLQERHGERGGVAPLAPGDEDAAVAVGSDPGVTRQGAGRRRQHDRRFPRGPALRVEAADDDPAAETTGIAGLLPAEEESAGAVGGRERRLRRARRIGRPDHDTGPERSGAAVEGGREDPGRLGRVGRDLVGGEEKPPGSDRDHGARALVPGPSQQERAARIVPAAAGVHRQRPQGGVEAQQSEIESVVGWRLRIEAGVARDDEEAVALRQRRDRRPRAAAPSAHQTPVSAQEREDVGPPFAPGGEKQEDRHDRARRARRARERGRPAGGDAERPRRPGRTP